MMDKIITSELIDKINDFFKKYNISKDCDDINDDIEIITIDQCIHKNKDLQNIPGKYDKRTRKIVIIDSKLTQRLFLHEYIHKKSVKHRLLKKDLIGVCYNECYSFFDEAITEKITCEILNIPQEEQMLHPYFSMFIAIEELEKLISWDKIIQSYFTHDISIYKNALGKDLKQFLNDVALLKELYPISDPKDITKKTQYQYIYLDIVNIISNHIS